MWKTFESSEFGVQGLAFWAKIVNQKSYIVNAKTSYLCALKSKIADAKQSDCS